MDDLYNNLENYYDEKIIDELKSENKDLKTKLEEYSSAMVRLQSDFDKLNTEYKKLEMNYSSLLKTARAEIERKSDMINSLNREKDNLVIQTIQSTGKNILTSRRSNFNDAHKLDKRHVIDSESVLKPQRELSLDNKNEGRNKNHRVNATWTQSEDTISSLENKSQFSDELRKSNNYYRDKMNKTKDNCTKEIHADDAVQYSRNGQNILNRRKQISRIEPIFSSDDDFEALNIKNIRKSPLREDTGHYERHSNKSYSPSKDLYKNKTNRYTDRDKYRHTDRYESGKRHGKYSPDKYRGDNYKDRLLRHPSSNNYNRSKSRDRRSNYERDRHNYDNDRHSPHQHDFVKNKSRNDFYEPSNKRQKIETYGTTDKNIKDIEREQLNLKDNFKKNQIVIEVSSCQSPDYDNVDKTVSQHVVKEIKHTAATPLEDPKVSSKKSAVKTNKEKTVSSTCISDNVDIIPGNISTWDMSNKKKLEIPEDTMKQLPVTMNDELVKEIYTDIDNPAVLNESLESGEILSVLDSNCYSEKSDKMSEHKRDNTTQNQKKLSSSLQIDSNELHKSNQDTKTNKYKIPKTQKPCKITTTTKKVIETNQVVERKICEKGQTSHQCNEVAKNNLYNIKQQSSNTVISEVTKLPINTLADDLELSDDANESKILQNDKLLKKAKQNASNVKNNSTIEINKKCQNLQAIEDKNIELNRSDPSKSKKTLQKGVPCDRPKPRKNKKKSEKSESNCTTVKEQNKLQDNQTGKEHKHIISIHTRNKFSDLFGDTSSLITPDDLGIPSPPIQLPLTDVFDNTQDAVDINVEDTKKTQLDSKESSCQTVEEISIGNNKVKGEISNNAKLIEMFEDCNKNSTTTNSSVNNLYENTKSETLSDISEIVKTVIISSGVQPKYLPENISLQNTLTTDIEYVDITIKDKENAKNCLMNSVKALATSTPQKPVHEELSTGITEPIDSNKSSQETNISSHGSNSLNHNSQEILTEVDVPDVRIFVRRRKKVTKKS